MSSPTETIRTQQSTDHTEATDSSTDVSLSDPLHQSVKKEVIDWLQRRIITTLLALFLTSWYVFQLVIATHYGTTTAEWWFYFKGNPSPGWMFAPISHNFVSVSHLQNNVFSLLIAGSVLEPYVSQRRYLTLFATIGFMSTVIPAVASAIVLSGPWLVAGASGGIYGLWAYLGISRRHVIQHIESFDQFAEGVIILIGIGLIIIVPLLDILSGGMPNTTAHITGILLGYALGYQQTDPLSVLVR